MLQAPYSGDDPDRQVQLGVDYDLDPNYYPNGMPNLNYSKPGGETPDGATAAATPISAGPYPTTNADDSTFGPDPYPNYEGGGGGNINGGYPTANPYPFIGIVPSQEELNRWNIRPPALPSTQVSPYTIGGAPTSGGTPTLQSILGSVDKKNWSTDLNRVKGDLGKLGYTLQVASDGTNRGRIYGPDGKPYDPFNDYGWVVPQSSGGGGGFSGMGMPAPMSAGGGAYSSASSGYGMGPMADAIQRLLSRGESSDYSNDPNMKAASSAHRAAGDRATARSRMAMAERSAAEGLNNGGQGSGQFDSAIQSQIEGQGIDQANFDSKMVIDEISARRSDVINALQFAQGEERIKLSMELAQMNDQLQRAQMGQQNTQFYDTMGYNMGRDNQNYNLNYLDLLSRG